VKYSRILYASSGNKRLMISLRAGPNIERYIVKKEEEEEEIGFADISEAVRYYNNLDE